MSSPHSIVIFIALAVQHVGGVTKTWIPNTNYDNPVNWDLERVPCSTDRVVFPSQLESSVLLRDGRTVVKELVLPSNGEILLPFTGSLVLAGNSRSTDDCPGEDMVFTRNLPAAWLDPANWKTEGHFDHEPVPHLERIPCTHDRIVFPAGSSFRVRLPEIGVTVGTISLLGQEMSPNQWQDALVSEPGERQFVSSEGDSVRLSSVMLTGEETCPDVTGCACAGHPDLQDAVCAHVRDRRGDCYATNLPPCVSPVQPVGHCCPICGAYMMLEYKQNLQPGRVKSVLQKYLGQAQYSQVVGHISKPVTIQGAPRHRLQIVLAETGEYSGASVELANVLASEVRNNDYFGVAGVNVFAAGEAIATSTWGSVLGTVFGTFIAALLVLAAIYFVFIGYSQKGWALKPQPFVFARFENAPSEGEEVLETRVEVLSDESQKGEDPRSSQAPPAAFDNPMYGNTKVAERTELPPAKPGHEVTHENPVYSELKRREEQQKEGTQVIDKETPSEEEKADTSDVQTI